MPKQMNEDIEANLPTEILQNNNIFMSLHFATTSAENTTYTWPLSVQINKTRPDGRWGYQRGTFCVCPMSEEQLMRV